MTNKTLQNSNTQRLRFEGENYKLIKSNFQLSKKAKTRQQLLKLVGVVALIVDIVEFWQAFAAENITAILSTGAIGIFIIATVVLVNKKRGIDLPYLILTKDKLRWRHHFLMKEKSISFSEVQSIHFEIDTIHFLMKEGNEEKYNFLKRLRKEKNSILHEELILLAEELHIPFTLSKTKNAELIKKYPERIERYKVKSRYVGH
ncbi:hypothetical protein [Sediminitomix flava]|uniref:Uncharacterized protein n=1 Tax=Sediminitomix flava TaxID=379075 RepID=A0A315ZHT8_SEDFL|nr:hypothetical protein [Sediminitomix flava]PWJ44872.1 hypothetical protein BC781_1011261 [Sediminitomix flava]